MFVSLTCVSGYVYNHVWLCTCLFVFMSRMNVCVRVVVCLSELYLCVYVSLNMSVCADKFACLNCVFVHVSVNVSLCVEKFVCLNCVYACMCL